MASRWVVRSSCQILDGRNKVFFFFGAEGIRQSEPEPTFSTVPTAARRNGDFSQLLTVNSSYQLYDPATGVVEGSRIRRQQFPGNIIPAARLNAVSKNFLQFLPAPNNVGGADGTNNYFNNAVRSDVFSSFMGRIDWNVSDRHKLFLSAGTTTAWRTGAIASATLPRATTCYGRTGA